MSRTEVPQSPPRLTQDLAEGERGRGTEGCRRDVLGPVRRPTRDQRQTSPTEETPYVRSRTSMINFKTGLSLCREKDGGPLGDVGLVRGPVSEFLIVYGLWVSSRGTFLESLASYPRNDGREGNRNEVWSAGLELFKDDGRGGATRQTRSLETLVYGLGRRVTCL